MFEHEVNPDNIKKAAFIVAIPSYNEADSIAFPVQQADQGIQSFFGNIHINRTWCEREREKF
jgi:hypothetical protein